MSCILIVKTLNGQEQVYVQIKGEKQCLAQLKVALHYSIIKSWYTIWGTLTKVMVSARNANPGHGTCSLIAILSFAGT
jgi:hypothetical protein